MDLVNPIRTYMNKTDLKQKIAEKIWLGLNDEAFFIETYKVNRVADEILSTVYEHLEKKMPSMRGHNWSNVTDYGKGRFEMLSEIKQLLKDELLK